MFNNVLKVKMCVTEARVVGSQASMNPLRFKIQETSQRNVFGDFLLQGFIKTVSLHETEKGLSNHNLHTHPQFVFKKREKIPLEI